MQARLDNYTRSLLRDMYTLSRDHAYGYKERFNENVIINVILMKVQQVYSSNSLEVVIYLVVYPPFAKIV